MAAKVTIEVENLPEILRKVDPKKLITGLTHAVEGTADAGTPIQRTMVPVRTGALGGSLRPTTSIETASGSYTHIAGLFYGGFVDRGTVHITPRRFSRRARTRIKPIADRELKEAANDFAKHWRR